ncbi:MAG: 30S ribosomal protein S6 [Bryobacterales bacterium]|nr:30S ribosomal protein S6 [Bryobacterales bacterium]
MRIYEELYILRPDATEEDVDASVEMVRTIVTTAGGSIDKVDKWGVRKLAYRLKKLNEGFYVLIQFSAKPEVVKELERRLRVSDAVVKFITVRIDEKLKWLEKRKKIREKRAARKPPPVLGPPAIQPAAPAPPPPAAPAPGLPAEPPVPAPDAPPPTE